MKGGAGRKIVELHDFSGGQVTRPPEKGIEAKYSVDCQNVYGSGLKLRERLGYTVVNPTVATGAGNGFYNWVKNISEQNLVTYFGTTLAKMDVVSSAWDGKLDTISADTSNGTPFTNAIMHFVTFNGTLIMTTENRDKPQFMRVTDSSHYNIEYLGAGVGPFAKYCQVWKNHLWFLNIGGGSELSDDALSLTSWTNNDSGGGATSQTTFDGKSTFRFLAGSGVGTHAHITKDIGTVSDSFSLELRTYFNTLTALTAGEYATFDLLTGVVELRIAFASDGIYIHNGVDYMEVGVDQVTQDVWTTWKFVVTAETLAGARVDVFKDGIPIGLQVDCSFSNIVGDGQIDIYARAAGSGPICDWYIDYMYINRVSATTNFLQNPQFESWGPLNGSCATFSTASGSYLQLSDHAAFTMGSAHTVELRINRAIASTAAIGLYTQSTATSDQIKWHIINNALVFSVVTAGVTVAYHSTDTLSWNTSEWYELALVRSGTALDMFRRGQQLTVSATTALGGGTIPDLSTNIYFGAVAGTFASLTGSMDEIRVSTSARYSSGYNVETANFTSDASTSLLLHLDSAYTDASSFTHTATTALGVALTTGPLNVFSWSASTSLTTVQEGTVIKEGTYSLKLSGTGSVSQVLSMPTLVSGSAAYVAGWVKPSAAATYSFVITDGTNTYNSDTFTGNGSGDWQYKFFPFTTVSSATNITISLRAISSSTFYMDSFSVIPTGTIAYSSDFSDRLQRSAIGFYNDFDGTDSGTNDIITPGDIGLTGSFILNDRMYVTKAWSIHRLSYTQSFPLIDIKQVKKTVGTSSPRATKNVDVPEQGEMVIFFGSDRRLYLFDGLIPIPLSDEITTDNGYSTVFFDNINTQALDKVYAIVHQDLNWYELFVPIGSSTTPNFSIVYDFVLKSFWPFSNRPFSAGDVSDNGSGRRRVYALTSTSGKIALLNQSNADDGVAISSYWTSVKLGVSQQLNRIDEVEVETTSVTSCTPTFSWRCDWESAYVSKTMGVSTNSHLFAPGRMDNLIQFKIANSTTANKFTLWTINMTERPIGIGK